MRGILVLEWGTTIDLCWKDPETECISGVSVTAYTRTIKREMGCRLLATTRKRECWLDNGNDDNAHFMSVWMLFRVVTTRVLYTWSPCPTFPHITRRHNHRFVSYVHVSCSPLLLGVDKLAHGRTLRPNVAADDTLVFRIMLQRLFFVRFYRRLLFLWPTFLARSACFTATLYSNKISCAWALNRRGVSQAFGGAKQLSAKLHRSIRLLNRFRARHCTRQRAKPVQVFGLEPLTGISIF